MRKGGHAGRTVTLIVRFANYKTISRAHTVEAPINLDRDIFEAAVHLFDRVDRQQAIRFLGVGVSNLLHEGQPRQLSLFGHGERRRHQDFLRSADQVRDHYGEHALVWGTLVRTHEPI